MNSFVKLRPVVNRSIRGVTRQIPTTTRKMHIKPLKMSWGKGDNYAYLVIDEKTKDAVIIDPAYPDDILPLLKPLIDGGDVKLTAIMNTHHHHDHSGGNATLLKTFKSSSGEPLPIIAGRDSPGVTQSPGHNSTFSFGSISVRALHTPCHTQDSICWYMTDSTPSSSAESGPERTGKAVFTGDTLFSGGCGRFFEGTGEEMDKALNGVLGQEVPGETRVYPGHEYTKSNAKFAVSVSGKKEVRELLEFAEKNEVTTGRWTMEEEKRHNVFMMLGDEEIREKTGEREPSRVMDRLREMKNSF